MKYMEGLDIKIKSPELADMENWINGNAQKINGLRGKLILLHFWNSTSAKSIRSVKFVKKIYAKYGKKNLVIIGIHEPEFDFAKDPKNIKYMIKKLGITYPIALDNDNKSAENFDNEYIPSMYLIDENGYVISTYFDDFTRSKIEIAIQKKLKSKIALEKQEKMEYMLDQSQDIYAGFAKNVMLGSGLRYDKKGCSAYVDSGYRIRDTLYPEGEWEQEKEYLELRKASGSIVYAFYAREANVVIEPLEKNVKMEIQIDDKKSKTVYVKDAEMYNVFKSKKYEEKEIKLIFNGNVRVYAFTFG